MYPYQRGPPMGNPYISPIKWYLWVIIPKNPWRTSTILFIHGETKKQLSRSNPPSKLQQSNVSIKPVLPRCAIVSNGSTPVFRNETRGLQVVGLWGRFFHPGFFWKGLSVAADDLNPQELHLGIHHLVMSVLRGWTWIDVVDCIDCRLSTFFCCTIGLRSDGDLEQVLQFESLLKMTPRVCASVCFNGEKSC